MTGSPATTGRVPNGGGTDQAAEGGRARGRTMSQRSNWARIVVFGAAALIIVLISAMWPRHLPYRPGRLRSLAAAIHSRALVPDPRGVVVLPKRWAEISVTRCAYVTYYSGELIILVPTWVGTDNPLDDEADHRVEGYVYDAGSPAVRVRAGDTIGWFLTGPAASNPWTAGSDRGTAELSLVNYKTMQDHWYLASQFS